MNKLRFPMFFDLHGRRAVVVGGGAVGARRTRVLLDFGACVTVIDPQSTPIPGTEHIARAYEPGDLEGAFLCTAATNDRETNRRVGADARKMGVFVSVADAPEECDFFFPAVCVGEDLVAGVVSDGGGHGKTARAAKEIRRVLEEME